MSKMKRVGSVLMGLFMILFGFLLFLLPEKGMKIIIIIIAISMVAYGLKFLTFYSTLARHMIGGKYNLYLGMIILNLGLLTATMYGTRTLPVFIYLFFLFGFSGILDVMKAFEEKKNKAPFWLLRLLFGLFSVSLGILAIFSCFIWKSPEAMTYLFCVLLLYSGFFRIVKAFRKTAVVYIQ